MFLGDRAQLIPGKQLSTVAATGEVGSGSSVESGSEVVPLQMEMEKSKQLYV